MDPLKLVCRKCLSPKPFSEVATRFKVGDQKGWRIRFKSCRSCRLAARKAYREKTKITL